MFAAKMIILYVPCTNESEAQKIGQTLLNEKLAACIQLIPVQSSYPWNGKLEQSNETSLIIKTLKSKSEHAKAIIKKLHSYEIPCIIETTVSVNSEYLDWMKKELSDI